MAVDTSNKRASVVGLCAAFVITLPAPDASITQDDRQHVAYSYAGISAATALSPTADYLIQCRSDQFVVRVMVDNYAIAVPAESVTSAATDQYVVYVPADETEVQL